MGCGTGYNAESERPGPPTRGFAAAIARRWAELPEVAKTPGQVLGRFAPGCEAPTGCSRPAISSAPRATARGMPTRSGWTAVTPSPRSRRRCRCSRSCAARARTPSSSTASHPAPPYDHAEALSSMRRHGREPISMTHGDIDYDYLRQLMLGPDGRRWLDPVLSAGVNTHSLRPAASTPCDRGPTCADLAKRVRSVRLGFYRVASEMSLDWLNFPSSARHPGWCSWRLPRADRPAFGAGMCPAGRAWCY